MKIKKLITSILEQKTEENRNAKVYETALAAEKASAIIDYNVMMGNIEDPEVDANAQPEL